MFEYKYPRPAITVDSVVFGIEDHELYVLFIQRKNEPFKGMWAAPGGFINMDETCLEAAKRELEEETGIKNVQLEESHTFSAVNRDPRERIITVTHFGLTNKKDHAVVAADDAQNAKWIKLSNLPTLAADHNDIVSLAYNKLKQKCFLYPIGEGLLSPKFTAEDLIGIYSTILGKPINGENVIKQLEDLEVVFSTENNFFCFNSLKYSQFSEEGFNLKFF